ncbi:13229_t:CDS:2 [Gigaspora rosea]|nr:13229_t:CDS:2 [Gigaspora rosea]
MASGMETMLDLFRTTTILAHGSILPKLIAHREKEVDTELTMSAGEIITSNDPGVLVLIAGDRD